MNQDDIHSISVNRGTVTFTWTVGQEPKQVPGFTVARIIRNENNTFLYHMVQYMVVVADGKGIEKVWKTYEGLPVETTHKIK